MAELSQFDAELLAQDLPGLAQVAIASSIYSAERGQLEYRAAGSESNPTVLMLHGLGSSSAGYRAQFAGLSRDFRAIAWNAPPSTRSVIGSTSTRRRCGGPGRRPTSYSITALPNARRLPA